ncbi:TetR/AcrR family transcriptional regulator [Lactobacillus terrae]|uniref:TetR/AcrR family transcriptional regulator n=1 Tax=Lactobacillus terrae TaxID=2269374 RepID=UPI000C1B797B|nr:TetR/AcrR family transcriptional regulator [Lactobacillus terrae]
MNLTREYLLDIVEKELSDNLRDKFTITELVNISDLSRSTVYYHFESLEEVYKSLFNERILPNIIVKNLSLRPIVEGLIDYIVNNKKICLNVYRLTSDMNRRDYIISLVNQAFYKYELGEDKINSHRRYLIGGFVFILYSWFEDNLSTDSVDIKKQVHSFFEMLSEYI